MEEISLSISSSISELQLDRGVAEAGRVVAAAGNELNARVESLSGRTGRALDTLTDQLGLYQGPYSFGCVGRGGADLRATCLGAGATCLGARRTPPPCVAARQQGVGQEGEEPVGTELKGEGLRLQGEGAAGEEREAQVEEPASFPGGAAPSMRDVVEGAAGLVGVLQQDGIAQGELLSGKVRGWAAAGLEFARKR